MLNNSVLASLGVTYFQLEGSISKPSRILSPLKPIVAGCNVALSTPGFKVKKAVGILVWES